VKDGAVKGVEKVFHGLPDVAPAPRKNLESLVERVEGLAGRIDILKSKRAAAADETHAPVAAAPAKRKAKAAGKVAVAAKKAAPRRRAAAKPAPATKAGKGAQAKREAAKPRRRTAAAPKVESKSKAE
jgi:hypothetical protein